jgi:transposase
MSEKKRRKWSAKENLRIVLTCMQPGVEVSEVCRREGINPNMYYNWKKRLAHQCFSVSCSPSAVLCI